MYNIENYQRILKEELTDVTKELKEIASLNELTNDWVAIPATGVAETADENVAADIVEEWNERRALMAQLEIRYRNIQRALKKIETGTFGVCEISSEPIETERLEANPAARTNIANKEREGELSL